MADEEGGPPPPNVVASSSCMVRAPQNVIWTLMKDYALTPKLYDPSVLHDRSVARDRVTRKVSQRLTKMSKPTCVLQHAIERDEPLEEDVPKPPPPEPVPGDEEPPAPAESEEAPAEEAPPEKWYRCEIRFPVSKLGLTAAEMGDCNGTISLRCTEKGGADAVECEVTVDVSIYSESLADAPPDFSAWAQTLTKNMKDYSEKMVYLAPNVNKVKNTEFTHSMLSKVKSFSWIPLKLSRSPSALGLLNSSEIRGSLGFYKDRQAASPIPVGLPTRAQSTV